MSWSHCGPQTRTMLKLLHQPSWPLSSLSHYTSPCVAKLSRITDNWLKQIQIRLKSTLIAVYCSVLTELLRYRCCNRNRYKPTDLFLRQSLMNLGRECCCVLTSNSKGLDLMNLGKSFGPTIYSTYQLKHSRENYKQERGMLVEKKKKTPKTKLPPPPKATYTKNPN